MISFNNGGNLIQSLDELPKLRGAKDVFVDFETSSRDPSIRSVNPWHNCEIAGICITVDDAKQSWYVPVGHNDTHWNVDKDNAYRWLSDIFTRCQRWINQNVKYDAHVAANAGISVPQDLVDTLTQAKIIDSDRGFGKTTYQLDNLSADWLDEDISHFDEAVQIFLKGCGKRGSKDYGDVPADIMGEYGCQDVLTTRKLHRYIDDRMPDQCRRVSNTELALTPVLFDMERRGLRIDPTELQKQELKLTHTLLRIEEEIHEMTGMTVRPHTNKDCFELLCVQHGLPVLDFTDAGEPSFDKEAMIGYLSHPDVVSNENLRAIVGLIQRYRKMNTLNNMFIKPYQEYHVDNYLHCDYNQAVRTGRMSCRRPNMQQLSKIAKKLVYPRPGYAFISADYSQVEFRFIIHTINNPAAIAAYAENPDTDFHTWVAEMCGIPRKPAKNINFAIGYGGGKKKITTMLAANVELVGHLMEEAGGDREYFRYLCKQRANGVYNDYHHTLPELKETSWRAQRALLRRGHVFNHYGRHRHLPRRAAWRAFNTITQADAADLMKERTVETAHRNCEFMQENDIHQVASVHDETLFEAPIEVAENPRTLTEIAKILEEPGIDLRVPIRVAIGVSEKSWYHASEDERKIIRDAA